MKKIRIINGANINFIGIREPNIYGNVSYNDIKTQIIMKYPDFDIEFFQSNHEGEIIDYIQKCYFDNINGIIINAGAYSHYSYSIADALKSISIPTIEVHLSNIFSREKFRAKSVLNEVCIGTICGFGPKSYELALEYFKII